VVNLGIFTAPGAVPAYVVIDTMELGTGVSSVPLIGIPVETTDRLRVEGFTTDPTRLIDIFAQDVHPVTGAVTNRLLGTTDPGTQPVRGRFRHIVNKNSGALPPTRTVLITTRTGVTPNVANGLTAGQYSAPNFGFIFSEGTTFGNPVPPCNFQDLPFLAQGSGPLNGTGPVVGRLDPWPGQ
jgi:hypothetical protein